MLTARRILCCLLVVLFSIGQPRAVDAQVAAFAQPTLAWSPDGKSIVEAGTFGIRVYSDQLEQKPVQFNDAGVVMGIAWSPDSRRIASANADYSVRIWDAGTGQLQARWDVHERQVTSIAWNPDGSKLATGSRDKTIRIWDAATGQVLNTWAQEYAVLAVGWSPDGTMLASGLENGTVQIQGARTGQVVNQTLAIWVLGGISWKGDSSGFVLGLEYVNSASAEISQVGTACSAGAGSPSVISRDGSRIAIANNTPDAKLRYICVVDAKDGKPLMISEVREAALFGSVAFSPDASRVVAVGFTSGTQVWDIATSTLMAEVPAIFVPIVMQPLDLTPLCSPEPDQYRLWRINNPNPVDVDATWAIGDMSLGQAIPTDSVVVPAAAGGMPGQRVFRTRTADTTDSVRLYSPPLMLQDTKQTIPDRCPEAAATPQP